MTKEGVFLSIEELFQDIFKRNIDYTLNYDLSPNIKAKLKESLSEIGYTIVDFHSPVITEEDKEKDKYVYSSVDTSIYLRFKDGGLEPLFMEDDLGTHYLMEEGTNSVAVSMKYSELCQTLGLPETASVSQVKTRFHNELSKAIAETKKKVLTFEHFNIIHIDSFLKNTETNVFGKLISDMPRILEENIPNIYTKVQSDIVLYLESNKEDSKNLSFKSDLKEMEFLYDSETKKSSVKIGFSISKIEEGKLIHKLISEMRVYLGTLNFNYDFSDKEMEEVNALLQKTADSLFRKKEYYLHTIKIKSENNPVLETINIYFHSPEMKKEKVLVGDVKELNEIFQKIVAYCKTGEFIADKKISKNYKDFFALQSIKNGTFKIIANAKAKDSLVELTFGSKGFSITRVGSTVHKYLEKNNISLENLVYVKGNSKSPATLDTMITIMNGLAKQIVWEGVLGFYDGRTTMKSALEKADSRKAELNPEIEAIRKKYNLPRNLNIIPDIEIVGEYLGVPILKGSTDRMIVVYGINGSNTLFLAKDEILNNMKEYSQYGFKEA